MRARSAVIPAGRLDSRVSASCASSTTPAAPATAHAAAECSPIPPCAQTGSSTSASNCWSRTNVVVSPTRPPASLPLAITAVAPRSAASLASSTVVTSSHSSTSAARSDSARRWSRSGAVGMSTTSSTGGRSTEMIVSVVVSSSGSIRTPQRWRPNLASVRTASTASCGSPTKERSTIPIAAALLAAIAIAGSTRPGKVMAANSNFIVSYPRSWWRAPKPGRLAHVRMSIWKCYAVGQACVFLRVDEYRDGDGALWWRNPRTADSSIGRI